MVLETITGWISGLINGFNNAVPTAYKPFATLGVFTVLIAIYAIFVWKFYRFLAKRDILGLNLRQYNRSNHPLLIAPIFGSISGDSV